MANITELLQKILNARYGKDVRGSIHDAIQEMNQEIEDDRPTVQNSMERAEAAAEKAEKCASDSERSKETADGSAKMAKSYTHGGTGLRENEATDNAKYYKEQVENKALLIEGYSQTASDAAQTATEAANRAEQSVSSIGISVEDAQAAATSAIESASIASNDAQNALQCASAALESAESSSQSASEAQASAEAAARSAEEAKAVANVDIATTEKAGIVKPDGTTITVDEDGTLHGQSKVDEMTGATADKDGTSGTVPAPLAGQEGLFLRGDGIWAKASGGSSIAPKATVDPAISSGNSKVTISWCDPEDVVLDGAVLSAWKGTKLVMKESGYPDNESDGALILDNTVRDAYKTSGYVVDGLTNGNTYYFALFPYSTDDVYNYSTSNRLFGNPSLVKLDSCSNVQISAAMGSATVSWDDPEATKTVDGNTATWAKTVLVYKQGSAAPNSPSDGTIAVTETARNQYASLGYEVTGLTDGEQYSFSLFAVSTEETPSDAACATAKLWATLTVTTTENALFGKPVTATNGEKTVSGVFDNSGSATLQIPWIGSTTVSSTDGTDTGDDTVDVAAYMTAYSATISFTLDGETATPIDDVQTWLKCDSTGRSLQQAAGITTLADVIANSDVLGYLMSDESAMKYLARSTGFAEEGCASETFMTALGASSWVDSTVLNSDLWISSISSSSYWDLIYPAVTVHSSASATITVAGKTFTSDASGNTQHSMPWGTFSISDTVSGQSFERTITRDTTDVYVMPDGALYWYGNNVGEFTDVSSNGSSSITTNSSNIMLSYTGDGSGAIITGKKIDVTNINSITFHGNWTNCNYYGVAILDHNILTNQYIHSDAKAHNFYKQSLTLDVSGMSGEYYIACACENSPSKTSTFTCTRVSMN